MTSYQIQRNRRAHSIKIKVDSHGAVTVVAPPDCPTRFIDQFVTKQQDWIKQTIVKIQSQRPTPLQDPTQLSIFGKLYSKEPIFDHQHPIGVQVKGKKIMINSISPTAASVEKAIQEFLKNTAQKYIVPRTHQLAELMSIKFNNITLRQQKTRWGSCSSQGNLNFNWRLVQYPAAIIDYVIIHELAHRREMNHSARFWEIVARFDPEHLKHRGWLRRNGATVD